MENIEIYLLIAIAILEVIDGQGIALRLLRMLMTIIGGQSDGEGTNKAKKVSSKQTDS